MLSQEEADILLQELKRIKEKGLIRFPDAGYYKKIDVESLQGNNKYIVDINRKGKINLSKYTYQKRFAKETPLLRLDIGAMPHTNPDLKVIKGPHLHIYKEGYGVKWAVPLPGEIFTNPSNMIDTLIEFLEYCKVTNINEIPIQGGVLDV